MKIDKRQTIMEGEIKVLKDTVWRLTTRVYGLEEQIKEMKTKLKLTTAVDSRLLNSQQILISTPPNYLSSGRGSRSNNKSILIPEASPSSGVRSSSRKAKERKSPKTVKFEDVPTSSKRNQSVRESKAKTRQIAVKKTGGSGSTAPVKTHRRLQHQSVITKRGRRATSFKLSPNDEEKEVYYVSDSSDDEGKPKTKVPTATVEKPKITKSQPLKAADSAADDFIKVLNEAPSGDYTPIEAHEDLIVFPNAELNIGNDGTGTTASHDDDDQLPIKKRRLDCGVSAPVVFEDDLFSQSREELVTETELAESVMEGVISYIHRPPESFNCFFCGQQFPTDEERAVHSKIHAGAPKKS